MKLFKNFKTKKQLRKENDYLRKQITDGWKHKEMIQMERKPMIQVGAMVGLSDYERQQEIPKEVIQKQLARQISDELFNMGFIETKCEDRRTYKASIWVRDDRKSERNGGNEC